MANLQPTVLEGIDLESFIQQLLQNHGPGSTLVVCSSKQAFLQELQATISQKAASSNEDSNDQPETDTRSNANEVASVSTRATAHAWTAPTLRLLASARTLQLAFCEDVPHLRAYLAAYTYRSAFTLNMTTAGISPKDTPRTLAILNPINLHRPTSNFSAQGLNRIFTAAVDAAYKSRSKLLIAECASLHPREAEIFGEVIRDEEGPFSEYKVWDQEVSILNVATKTFGAGERGWVGRTVKLRVIASRWCVFGTWPEGQS